MKYVFVGLDLLSAVAVKSFIFWDITSMFQRNKQPPSSFIALHDVISQEIELFLKYTCYKKRLVYLRISN
jgi:hypothetical protein